MIIATYNLHCGGDGGSPVHWRKLLDEGVDVLLVQESAPPERYLGSIAPGCAAWHQVDGRTWGSGIYTAHGLAQEIPLPRFGGWVAGAVLDLAGVPTAIFSLHNPTTPGRKYGPVLHDVLDDITRLHLGCPLVIGGDFNLVSAGRRQAGEARRTEVFEQAILDRLEEEFGLVSAWEVAHPEAPLPQTLRWQGDRSIPYHCDAIFVPCAWRKRIESCTVLQGPEWNRLSDHNPVLASIREPAREPRAPETTEVENKAESSLLERAIAIAVHAHTGATDKAGQPYILHPLRLMLAVATEEERIAAVLHDVVEDTDWTIARLQDEGFGERVLAAIDALTRRKDVESYEEFILRAGANPLARVVKLADLADNLDISRLGELTERDLERLNRYKRAVATLERMR